jgi:hypothetical protein
MRISMIALSFLLAGLIAFGSASPAAADGPIVVGPFHIVDVVEFADCGAFKVDDHFVLDVSRKLYFDKDGTLIKIIADESGTDTLVNRTTGKSYTGRFHNTGLIDPTTATLAGVGIIVRITVPGSGAVFLDVGRFVRNSTGITFEAGPHQLFDGDLAGLCAALA